MFHDRQDAGKKLAEQLKSYKNQENTILLALPRGGVVVAAAVQKQLNLPLDVILVRKLGVPYHQELAFGSIAMGDVTVFNTEILESLNLSEHEIQQVITKEQQELQRREARYRSNRPALQVANQTVIIIDDGLATGATMRSAIKALKQLNPAKIIVAIPVAPYSTYQEIQALVDEVICLETPYPFNSIGMWYFDFAQTSDEEVIELLGWNKTVS